MLMKLNHRPRRRNDERYAKSVILWLASANSVLGKDIIVPGGRYQHPLATEAAIHRDISRSVGGH